MEVLQNSDGNSLNEFIVTKNNFDKDKILEGSILLFDKPYTWSSFKLVKKVKYITKAKRVGHAGTLDPLASGLLIIATGKCTKLIEQIQNQKKTYTGTITFGAITDSYDLEKPLIGNYAYDNISDSDLLKATQKFIGEIEQIPPAFSAIKVNGARAYKLARQGVEPQLKSRIITIEEIKIENNLPNIPFKIICSKGTYIRSIAHRFGEVLNSGSHLTSLRREAIGNFSVEDAFKIEEFIEFYK